MPRYGRDYEERNFLERGMDRARRWMGGHPGERYDHRAGYRGQAWGEEDYDRDYGWLDRDGQWGPRGYAHEPRYGQVDYRGGYGRTHRTLHDEGYGGDYRRPRMGRDDRWYGHDFGRGPRRDPWGPEYGYGFLGESYGDYGLGMFRGGGLFRSGRGGGIRPGEYFRGYGVGSAGGYEPY